MPSAMTAFWSLPIWAIYSVITGVTRRPGACPGIEGTAATARGASWAGAWPTARPRRCVPAAPRGAFPGDGRRHSHRVREVIQMTASMAGAPVASWRQGPFTRRFMLYQDTIARGHEVQPLMGVRAEVHPAGSGMRGMRFLTIIGPGFAWTQRSDVLHQGRCRKFAAKINATAATAR